MKKLIICIASKEEADLLIPSGLEDLPVYTVITGYGMGATVNAIREYAYDDCTVLNIGFVGATDGLDIHELYNINVSLLGPNEHNLSPNRVLPTFDNMETIPCVTVTDFEVNPKRFYPKTCYTKDYVVDMELYTLANYFNKVYSIKIPSDTGSMDEYYSQHKYKDKLNILKYRIYDIIKELIEDEND